MYVYHKLFSLLLYRIIETTPSPRQTDPETDSVGEVTETKHTADVMSPDPDIAMDTSGLASGEREQPLNTEMIEILASTLEEICIYLKQAQQLIVSLLNSDDT